jgi:nicotinate-nucleotide adenylyltransferase
MRLGIFGGTFDPPHIGHLILAAEAQFQLKLDRVLWVLTPVPPHKLDQQVTPVETRLDLLQAALDCAPTFEISRVDIDRPGPHYASETVRLLNQQHPEAALIYLMGGDSLVELPSWHAPRTFIRQLDELGVMSRPGFAPDLAGLEAKIPSLTRRVRFLDVPLLEISSTQLREAIASGGAYRYYLPSGVYKLIRSRRLYEAQPAAI